MLRILVVDDDAQVRKTLMHLLMLSGHMVVTTGDGTQAIHLCKDLIPDVVIVDIHLGLGSGVDVVEALKYVVPRPCVIVITGDQETAVNDAIQAGADDFLLKPFGIDEMLKKFTVSAA